MKEKQIEQTIYYTFIPKADTQQRSLIWTVLRAILQVVLDVIRYFVGWIVSLPLLPSQFRRPGISEEELSDGIQSLNTNERLEHYNSDIRYKQTKTTMPDGAIIDGVHIENLKQRDLKNSEKKFIIKMNGNSELYQEALLHDTKSLALEENADVIIFDYPNVAFSSRRNPDSYWVVRFVQWFFTKSLTANDLVQSTIAQIQRVLDLPAQNKDDCVNPNNIIVKGFSLGSAVATLAVKHFHDQGIKINLFNKNTFNSFSNAAIGVIEKRIAYIVGPGIATLCAYFITPFVRFILYIMGWEISVDTAYQALDYEHKDYSQAQQDEVLAPYARLMYSMGIEVSHLLNCSKETEDEWSNLFYSGHNDSDSESRNESGRSCKAYFSHFCDKVWMRQ